MSEDLFKEPKKPLAVFRKPHLSHSRINRYLHCPEQYRLYYIENLRPRFPAASLVFGQIMHRALAHFFQTHSDPVKLFLENWNDAKQLSLTYSRWDSWEKLHTAGQALLEKFLREELPRLGTIAAVEKAFELDITSLDLPFIGIIDLIAEVDGKGSVVGFKTAGSAYGRHEAILSNQLTAYQLAEPEAEQMALCVLVKTKEPKIEWHIVEWSGEQLREYLSKAELVAHEITAGHFYKRPGKWCAWYDYLPVCLGDTEKVKKTLVQIGHS